MLYVYVLFLASPVSTKTPAALNTTEKTIATAESAKEAPTPVTGNHDNKDSVGSPKPTKVLSALVAYGDDSDSDIDT
jgi:biotin carboxyl carrier protein